MLSTKTEAVDLELLPARPRVVALIPAHDEAAGIAGTIEAMIDQTFVPEVVVVPTGLAGAASLVASYPVDVVDVALASGDDASVAFNQAWAQYAAVADVVLTVPEDVALPANSVEECVRELLGSEHSTWSGVGGAEAIRGSVLRDVVNGFDRPGPWFGDPADFDAELTAWLAEVADGSARTRDRAATIVALLPAHNEEDGIADAIRGLRNQTRPPDRIVVVADNCTDGTIAISLAEGAEIVETKGNRHKKAGALNQALEALLPTLADDDVVLVQDADSALDEGFLECAEGYLHDRRFGAIGGTFRGGEGAGFLGHLQRNEYARYGRDVRRLRGKCLVVTGTAATFRVKTLREIGSARVAGKLPPGDRRAGVYDTSVLTEDNELTFAIRHLGYEVLSPAGCTLVTEVMETWSDLWKQRLRWKRGAVENCFQYGLTRVTWPYWGRQLLTLLGVLVTFVYLGTLLWAGLTGSFTLQPFWLAVSLIFVVERVVTVRDRGWRHMLAAAVMYELLLDLFLQFVHAKAYFDALTGRQRNW
ncbi:glycosyltransferase family 2 protein [Herbiconiux sp. SYSU D00978]|uniref:glycosyltransferase family 2 protein n=1 Tax=Herbiconiux sp. SYSU D00978 TaxID=2812562 RepID=UPI001F61B42E|nr:glycosyltransferase family 2 protein [Herbiconiux sp. SYSU D00978]